MTKRRLSLVDRLTIIIFLGVLVSGLVMTVVERNTVMMPLEKRMRATRPAFSVQSWFANQWQPAFEKFVNDHLGGRDTLVSWNSLVHLAWFHQSTTAIVLAGQNGQLIYTGEDVIADYQHRRQFTASQLTMIRQHLQTMRDEVEQRGGTFVVLIAPNTPTIYPQSMPPVYRQWPNPSRFDQVMDAVQGSGVTVLDPRQPLRQASQETPVYYQTDTHWNTEGAFVAYTQLMSQLQTTDAALHPRPRSDFHIVTGVTEGGDLATALSLSRVLPETNRWLVPNQPTKAYPVTVAFPQTELSRSPEAVQVDTPGLPTAVMFRDSFSNALEPLLNEHFRRIVYVRSTAVIPSVLEAEKPRVVILEITERYLSKLLVAGGIY
jgi:hypothetical protein